MKIFLIADPSNPHTIKWANSLSAKGLDIFLFGLAKFDKLAYNSSIKIESLKTPKRIKAKTSDSIYKILYFSAILRIRKLINDFKPDIVHAHYAGSNGLLGALSGFHPYILSVWGVDINVYPNISIVHKFFIQYALKKSDIVLATSNSLKKETKNYTSKEIQVTPFGINIEMFKPKKINKFFNKSDIVIGTVKGMEDKYGIDLLIKAFAKLREKHETLPLRLLLVGGGSRMSQLINLANQLGVGEQTVFAGNVKINEVVDYHNMIDISVYLSRTESFGVSVLEASACEKPVVVHDVGGLPEIVDDEITGLIVPANRAEESVMAIEKLVLNPELGKKMGRAGRKKVIDEYNWENNVQQMINIYKQVIQN